LIYVKFSRKVLQNKMAPHTSFERHF